MVLFKECELRSPSGHVRDDSVSRACCALNLTFKMPQLLPRAIADNDILKKLHSKPSVKKFKMNHHNNHELAEADACSRRIRNELVLCYILIITVNLFFYVNDVGSEDATCLVISHELDCGNGSRSSSLMVRRRLKYGPSTIGH
ncbi:unnamed protein product, partial [Brenthis ino]